MRLGLLVFLAGIGSLSTEMCASRLVAPYFGSSNVVWANVIALMLAFLALGYWLGGIAADRYPSARVLVGILLAAAALLAVVPFAAKPVLHAALGGFASISVAVVAGSFFGVLALFVLPVTLLGTVAPFALRLAVGSVERTGRASGRLYALSTVGSILGTFLSALVAIPLIGTQRTLLATAAVVAAAAVPLSLSAAAAAAAVLALVAVPVGRVKPDRGLLWETESQYNYIRVVAAAGGKRELQLNEGVADQSVWYPHTVLTGGYWDLFLLLPQVLGRRPRSLLVLGDGGGTIPRGYARFYPRVAVDGVELDPAVTEAARRFLGLDRDRRLRAITADARVYLEHTRRRYDLIAIDAYRQPYIPFQLTTLEFFRLVRAHLKPGGVVALNVAATPRDRRLTEDVGTTLRAVLPQVWRVSALDFSDLVLGLTRPLARAELVARLRRAPRALLPLLPRVEGGLALLRPHGRPWTDDRAPVEWVTDRMLAEQIARGQGLDENLLPTAP